MAAVAAEAAARLPLGGFIMVTIRVEAQLSPDQLLAAVEQLGAEELDQFLGKIVALWARRHGRLSAAEKQLLETINAPLPGELRRRYDELKARRDAETLTPAQHRELLRLSDQVEALQAERVKALAEMARRRNTTLTRLLKELGLTTESDE
jgi:hypothetical protein